MGGRSCIADKFSEPPQAQGFTSSAGCRHVKVIPHSQERIASYHYDVLSKDPTVFDAPQPKS